MAAYIASLNGRLQVTLSVAGPAATYPGTIGSASWRLQVRDSERLSAPVLLDSAVGGTVTYIPGAAPAVCFQWPESVAATITPAFNCPFDFVFWWTSPPTDDEPAGAGVVSFTQGITQAGVSGAAPTGADDTWMLVGAPATPSSPSLVSAVSSASSNAAAALSYALASGASATAAEAAAAAAQSPNCINVASLGIVPGSDQTTLLLNALRPLALARPGSTILFPASASPYQFLTPKFLYGVSALTIIAYGASFQNLGAGTYGGADMNASLYLGSGPTVFSMTPYSVIDGGGNPEPGIVANSGDILQAPASAGDRTIVLLAAAAALYSPGDAIMLHWFSRMLVSFPPFPGFFEYNFVVSVSISGPTGTVTLRNPLRHDYQIQAPDQTTFSCTTGVARCLHLNRSDFQIAQSIRLFGGTGVVTGAVSGGSAPWDGSLEIAGALSVEVYDANFSAIMPSMVRNVYTNNSIFYGSSLLDKMIELLDFDNFTTLATSDAFPFNSQGVWQMRMRGRSRLVPTAGAGGLAQLSAVETYLDDIDVMTQQSSGGTRYQIDRAGGTGRRTEIKRCKFFPGASINFGVTPGNLQSFTPDSVTATQLTVLTSNAQYEHLLQSVDVGSRIIIGNNTNPDVFAVKKLTFDSSNNLQINGICNVAAASIAAASVPRSLYLQTRAQIGPDNKAYGPTVDAGQGGFQLVNWNDTAYNGSPYECNEDGEVTFLFPIRAAGANQVAVNCVVSGVEVFVPKAYTGTDASATLALSANGNGGVSWNSTINLLLAATRVIGFTTNQTSGAQSGDTLNNIPQGVMMTALTLYVYGPTQYIFADNASSSLPIAFVKIKGVQF